MTADTHALGAGFTDRSVDVDGRALHYVHGGQGPVVVLLHGFPQDWFEWRHVLPRLADRYTVVAPDLPGIGGSAPSPHGVAAADLARAVHGLLDELGVASAHVVGHDVGGAVAYAFARAHPERTRSVAVLETPVAGIDAPPAPAAAGLWHVGFHMTPELPEALVAGRQATYFRYFFDTFTHDPTSITDDDVAHYAAAYGSIEQLRAAFGFYRAMGESAEHNARQTGPVRVPLLLVGGEHMFGAMMPGLAATLRTRHGWSDVEVRVVAGAAHYLVEEAPEQVAALLGEHLAAHP